MVLVFILLAFIIIVFAILVILLLSNIQVEIKDLNMSKLNNKNRVDDRYEIKISINFLEKVPILFTRIDNEKGKKIYNKLKLKNIRFNKFGKENLKPNELINFIKNIKIRSTKFYFYMNIGTENAIFTSYIVAVIASAIGIIIPHLAKDNIEKCNYRISPIYNNCNQYDIKFDGIFCIKVVHIIYSLICLIKKGNGENDERTSNRRTYAISNG